MTGQRRKPLDSSQLKARLNTLITFSFQWLPVRRYNDFLFSSAEVPHSAEFGATGDWNEWMWLWWRHKYYCSQLWSDKITPGGPPCHWHSRALECTTRCKTCGNRSTSLKEKFWPRAWKHRSRFSVILQDNGCYLVLYHRNCYAMGNPKYLRILSSKVPVQINRILLIKIQVFEPQKILKSDYFHAYFVS
jgi:hypothetical protein